ncbi:MAG: Rrf2 family transcriptional regulator [Spirochaetales bacterium]|nr:Rrf2 family transcriptional regulator [Spirochaetales bacterium]
MFSLSAKGVYGAAALVELAEHYRSGPIQIRDIASRNDIPQHYLEQILSGLKRTGLVRSYRGAQGGYELTRHPDTIRLVELLSELEGPLSVTPSGQSADNLAFLWGDLEQHIAAFLNRSLGDVMREKARRNQTVDFVI